jgi:hypothetical protein
VAERTFEEVRDELHEVRQRLDELPRDSFAERVALRDRWLELRAQAVELQKAARPREDMEKELQELRRLRSDIYDRHLSVGNIGGAGGEGGGGIDIRYVLEVNEAIDQAWDHEELDRRIAELEAELARRNQEPRT